MGRAALAMQSDSLTSVDVIARSRGQAYMMKLVMQELAQTPEFLAQREQGLVDVRTRKRIRENPNGPRTEFEARTGRHLSARPKSWAGLG